MKIDSVPRGCGVLLGFWRRCDARWRSFALSRVRVHGELVRNRDRVGGEGIGGRGVEGLRGVTKRCGLRTKNRGQYRYGIAKTLTKTRGLIACAYVGGSTRCDVKGFRQCCGRGFEYVRRLPVAWIRW